MRTIVRFSGCTSYDTSLDDKPIEEQKEIDIRKVLDALVDGLDKERLIRLFDVCLDYVTPTIETSRLCDQCNDTQSTETWEIEK